MKPRRVVERDATPDGERIELLFEAGHYVVRVDGAALMSSAMYGSEQAMAEIAAERLGPRPGARVLIGGLGLGFTLRAALDCFPDAAQIAVAELLPAIVRFQRGELAELTGHPLDDRRTRLHEGSVEELFDRGAWDVVLMDIDNGPEAFTVAGNASIYRGAGLRTMVRSLAPGGVLVVWSAFPSPAFEKALRREGLRAESVQVRARASGKGPRHTLFVGQVGD